MSLDESAQERPTKVRKVRHEKPGAHLQSLNSQFRGQFEDFTLRSKPESSIAGLRTESILNTYGGTTAAVHRTIELQGEWTSFDSKATSGLDGKIASSDFSGTRFDQMPEKDARPRSPDADNQRARSRSPLGPCKTTNPAKSKDDTKAATPSKIAPAAKATSLTSAAPKPTRQVDILREDDVRMHRGSNDPLTDEDTTPRLRLILYDPNNKETYGEFTMLKSLAIIHSEVLYQKIKRLEDKHPGRTVDTLHISTSSKTAQYWRCFRIFYHHKDIVLPHPSYNSIANFLKFAIKYGAPVLAKGIGLYMADNVPALALELVGSQYGHIMDWISYLWSFGTLGYAKINGLNHVVNKIFQVGLMQGVEENLSWDDGLLKYLRDRREWLQDSD